MMGAPKPALNFPHYLGGEKLCFRIKKSQGEAYPGYLHPSSLNHGVAGGIDAIPEYTPVDWNRTALFRSDRCFIILIWVTISFQRIILSTI